MSQLERDIESARNWLVSKGAVGLKIADAHNSAVSNLLSAVDLIAACAELPGDMPLRVRLTPNVFRWRA